LLLLVLLHLEQQMEAELHRLLVLEYQEPGIDQPPY
jgi:hypothetical protein